MDEVVHVAFPELDSRSRRVTLPRKSSALIVHCMCYSLSVALYVLGSLLIV